MERSKADVKKSHDGLSLPKQDTIIRNIIWYYLIKNGKSTL